MSVSHIHDAPARRESILSPSEIERLVAEHQNIVWSIAYKTCNRTIDDLEEIVGDGFVGLMQAALSYDPARGVKFSTWASFRIKGEIIDGQRRYNRISRTLSDGPRSSVVSLFNDTTAMSVFEGLVLPDETPGAEEVICEDAGRRELLENLLSLIARLPHDQRYVVEQYFLAGRAMKPIGKDLHLTDARVSQIKNDAVTHLRSMLRSMAILQAEGAEVLAQTP